MYRDLFHIRDSSEGDISAGTTLTFGPYTLFNTRAFLIQLKGTTVPSDTELFVYLSTDFTLDNGNSKDPKPPMVSDENAWSLIHNNGLFSSDEPLIYEKCQTVAEWLRFKISVPIVGGPLQGLDIVLGKQAWR